MHKHLIFTALSFLFTCVLYAQPHYFDVQFETLVFGDKVNVREKPGTDAAVIAQLKGGDYVTILAVTEQPQNVGGIDAPWYQIAFGDHQKGWVWGGTLSTNGLWYVGQTRISMGLTAFKKGTDDQPVIYMFEMRAFNAQGQLLDKAQQKIESYDMVWVTADSVKLGALGMSKYAASMMVSIGFPACGHTTWDWYVLWDGKKFKSLPLCGSNGEAGIGHHLEYYLFPEPRYDGGPSHYFGPDKLFFVVEEDATEYVGDDESQGWTESSNKVVKPVKLD